MESDEKTSSRKFGRRGFLITMGFGAAASALLRKLPGKPSTEISQTAGDLVSFPPTQGWGVCLLDDGRLAMSNGSDSLSFRDSKTFEVIDSVEVTLDGVKVEKLNELECDDQTVWANIWQTDRIVGIELSTGHVTHVLDASNLPLDRESMVPGAVLNGIARIPDSENFLITGKLWPKIFEVSFTSD